MAKNATYNPLGCPLNIIVVFGLTKYQKRANVKKKFTCAIDVNKFGKEEDRKEHEKKNKQFWEQVGEAEEDIKNLPEEEDAGDDDLPDFDFGPGDNNVLFIFTLNQPPGNEFHGCKNHEVI